MNKWTDSEVETLRENYNKLPNSSLLKLFPNRSYLGIYKKAYKMGMKKDNKVEYMNRSECRKGEKGSNWKGGRKTTPKGYVEILRPEHHRADANGYVMEHIVVFEEATGIKVTKNLVIHHLDGNKQNNDISNLALMEFGAHSRHHNLKRKLERSDDLSTK